MKTTIYDRVAGCVYGQFVGDALGTRYEFRKKEDVIRQINKDRSDNDNFLHILGGGVFNLISGSVTDDTELGYGLMRSIIDCKMYDQNKVAQTYIRWFNSDPFDIGKTTHNAFYNANNARDMLKNAETKNLHSLSNGCLMRVFSLGILASVYDIDIIKKIGSSDCKLTNPHPSAQSAVIAFITAIGQLIRYGDKKRAKSEALKICDDPIIMRHIEDGCSGIDSVYINQSEDESIVKIDGSMMGYLGIAIQLAFYELFHGDDFESSLIRTIERGGDTDTNGCIVGTLIGAYYGVNFIPENWKRTIRECQNPRKEKYKEIDQRTIDKSIDQIYELISSKF